MFIVTVEFVIKKEHLDEFMVEMMNNAASSLQNEEGCLQFDVCQDLNDPVQIFLYEVYTSAGAFDVHLKSQHFLDFDKTVKVWTLSKTARQWTRCKPI